MASRHPATFAKREREQALRERRDRKRAKKDAVAAARNAPAEPTPPVEPDAHEANGTDAVATP